MDKQPLITIVTITYNLIKNGRKDYIIQNIESVHNQTYKNIEQIIIDGASTDGTLELLKPFEEKGWIKIYSEPDNGIYDAMNKGLAKVHGKYIAFLNSDDFYHNKHGIKKVVKCLIKSKSDFVFSTCKYLTENGTFIGCLEPVPENFYIRMPFSHQTLFVNTDLMKKLGGFDDKNFKTAGDYDFIIRLYMSGACGSDYHYNFVSYRLGGFSDLQQKQSINECIKSFKKNYGKFPFIGENYEFSKMFCDFQMSEVLFKKIKEKVSTNLKLAMDNYWVTRAYLFDDTKFINRYPLVKKIVWWKKYIYPKNGKYNQIWNFYGFPIFKIKQKNLFEKKCYLFRHLPIYKLIKTKFATKYYFCGIPLCCIKKKGKSTLFQSNKSIFGISGFSEPEPWGIWSSHNEVTMGICVKNIKKRELILSLTLKPYLGKSLTEQIITVLANDQQIAEWHVNKEDVYTANIPASVMTSNELKLMFKISNPLSPKSEDVSEDTRKLGIGFINMVLKEKKLEMAFKG